VKNQHSCGLLLDVVSDVIELKYESHVDILYDSLAYKGCNPCYTWGLWNVISTFYSIPRGYTIKYFCAKSLQLFLSLQFFIFRSFASWIEILFGPFFIKNGLMVIIFRERARVRYCESIYVGYHYRFTFKYIKI